MASEIKVVRPSDIPTYSEGVNGVVQKINEELRDTGSKNACPYSYTEMLKTQDENLAIAQVFQEAGWETRYYQSNTRMVTALSPEACTARTLQALKSPQGVGALPAPKP